MRTFVDLSDLDLRMSSGRVLLDLKRAHPLASDFETPQRLAHTNAWRVFFEVPDSPEGMLL